MIGIDDQISEAVRELAMRERLFPNWVKLGKKKKNDAVLEIMRQKAIVKSLEWVKAVMEGGKVWKAEQTTQMEKYQAEILKKFE